MKQVLAISLEGVCAVIERDMKPHGESGGHAALRLRDSFTKALAQLRKAIPSDQLKIILYTRIPDRTFIRTFMPVLRPLLRLPDSIPYLVDRIIFINVNFINVSQRFELKLARDLLPLGAQDILWVHPLGLDEEEIKDLVKVKRSDALLYTIDGSEDH